MEKGEELTAQLSNERATLSPEQGHSKFLGGMAQVISAGSRRGRGKVVKDRSLGKVKRSWEVRKEQRVMWAAALDL